MCHEQQLDSIKNNILNSTRHLVSFAGYLIFWVTIYVTEWGKPTINKLGVFSLVIAVYSIICIAFFIGMVHSLRGHYTEMEKLIIDNNANYRVSYIRSLLEGILHLLAPIILLHLLATTGRRIKNLADA